MTLREGLKTLAYIGFVYLTFGPLRDGQRQKDGGAGNENR
jgi:hypothetical protein